LSLSDREIWYKAGQRYVVDYLIEQQARQKDTMLTESVLETAPRPEKTAERVVVGSQRRPGSTRRGRRSRTLGTASLQIPLLNEGQTGMGNLNY